MLKDCQDAFGHLLYDHFKNEDAFEIVQRDDGLFYVEAGPRLYFSHYQDWSSALKKALKYARGKILDIGCGAGRHSLYLQEKGFDVLAIDVSPLAIKVCELRGVKKTKVMSITQISRKLRIFDTLLLLGGNFGLMGNFQRARWLLKKFGSITKKKATIIAQAADPYQSTDSLDLEYHSFNRKRGRMPGQLRVRVRYKKYVSPWTDRLLVSKDEMREILKGTGWHITHFLDGSLYIAIIEKEAF